MLENKKQHEKSLNEKDKILSEKNEANLKLKEKICNL